MSTGAGNRARISLIASYVSRQRVGAGCGFSRAFLIGFCFCGDADADSDFIVRVDGLATTLLALPLTLPVGSASGTRTDDSVSSPFPLASSSTLMRFERRAVDACGDGTGTGSGLLLVSPTDKLLVESSSLNKVTAGSAELC